MDSRQLFRLLLASHGLNPTSLSKKLKGEGKPTQPTLARWLSGDVVPLYPTVAAVASYFGLSADDFLDPDRAEATAQRLGLSSPTDGAPAAKAAPVMREAPSELMATQIMLMALIQTHPDKRTLLASFDGIVSGMRVHALASGAGEMPEPLRQALARFREQIEQTGGSAPANPH